MKRTNESTAHESGRHDDNPFPASNVVKTVDLMVSSVSGERMICGEDLQEGRHPSTFESRR